MFHLPIDQSPSYHPPFTVLYSINYLAQSDSAFEDVDHDIPLIDSNDPRFLL